MIWQGDPGDFFWLPWHRRKPGRLLRRIHLNKLDIGLALHASSWMLWRASFVFWLAFAAPFFHHHLWSLQSWPLWLGWVASQCALYAVLASLHDVLAASLLLLGAPEAQHTAAVPMYSRRPRTSIFLLSGLLWCVVMWSSAIMVAWLFSLQAP